MSFIPFHRLLAPLLLPLLASTLGAPADTSGAVTLQPSFENAEDSATAALFAKIDREAAATYASLTRQEKGPFLESYWRAGNPFVLKFFFGYHLGQRRYSVSEAFYERGSMIIKRYRTGFPPLNRQTLEEAASLVSRLIDRLPNDPVALGALGYIYLELSRCEEAEILFAQAIKEDRHFVEGWLGRALSLMGQRHKKRKAFGLLHETLALDPDYAGAHYAICMCHIAMMGPDRVDVDFYIEKLLSKFPNHPDAHFKLGAFYEALRYYDRAAAAYSRQLAANPSHDRAAEQLARVSLILDAKNKAPISLATLRKRANRRPDRYLPLLAEVLIRQGQWQEAESAFERYLDLLGPNERIWYEDVSLLTTDEEHEELSRAVDRLDRNRLRRRFWVLSDPTPTTPVNERRVEHYRRVFNALTNFTSDDEVGRTRPWDRRGDIYIRFGHPDHQTWSDNVVFETDSDVAHVKTRLNTRATEALHEIVPPSSFVSGTERGLSASADIRGIPTFPLPRGASTFNDGAATTYAWESWIYTEVGGGIELTFTDRLRNGTFDFVEPPVGTVFTPLWEEMAPATVTGRVIEETPSVYHHNYGGDPVDLYVDVANFRGRGRRTRAEIYTGVPLSRIGHHDGAVIRTNLHREVALYDRNWHLAERDSSVVTETTPADAHTNGTLLVDQTNFELYPGPYFIAVQVRDPDAGKIQIYRVPLVVEAFADSGLALSSLEVAGRIDTSAVPGPFSKGDIDVVPLPSHTYAPEQSIGLYYEVYNLARDDFGRTRYRVDYAIETTQHEIGFKSGLGRLLGRSTDRGMTRVSYDHEGTEPDDPIHVTLDVPDVRTDPVGIAVSVTDLNARGEPTRTRSIELFFSE